MACIPKQEITFMIQTVFVRKTALEDNGVFISHVGMSARGATWPDAQQFNLGIILISAKLVTLNIP